MSSPSQPPSGSEPQPAQPESAPDKSGIDTATDVEIQRRFNELRHELLDHRVKLADRWLAAMAVFLTFFGVVAVIVGYLSFQRFEDIETRAEGHMKTAGEHAEEAERLVNLIRGKYAELENLDAESIGKNLAAALREAENVQEDPTASPIDQAIAAAVQLQGQEKIEAAREMWRYIARVTEGVDRQLQAQAWFSVGYLHSEEDNWEAAIDAYDKALELKPDMLEAYNNRGNAKSRLSQHDSALADYNEAIRLRPNYAMAYNNRGNAKDDLGQHDEALADLNEAIRLRPDMAETYNNRGVVKRNLGQPDEALADYNEAIRLDPDHAMAYNNRGITKEALGQSEAALADYNEAIRLNPDYAEAYNNRGITKRKLGRLNEAREDYQRALALAQESGNEDLIAKVQHNLSNLDNDKAP